MIKFINEKLEQTFKDEEISIWAKVKEDDYLKKRLIMVNDEDLKRIETITRAINT